MKKNLYIILCSLFLFTSPGFAATTVEVEAITPFNSANPPKIMQIAILERVEFENGIVFENGSVVIGDVVDVKQPTRGKRNATFKFQPTSSYYKGKTTKILDSDFIAKYKEKKPLNKGELALSGATTAGSLLFNIPFLSQGVSLVKGMVKNENGNRLKSGAIQVYKDSPVAYIEEGKDIVLAPNDIFYLKFKVNEADDLDSDVDLSTNEQDVINNDVAKPNNSQDIFVNDNNVQLKHEELKVDFGTKKTRGASSLDITQPEEVLLEVENSLKLDK